MRLSHFVRFRSLTEFGNRSAAWYVTSQSGCTQARNQLVAGNSDAGWPAYVSQCLGTTMTDERAQYHQRALQALGVSSATAAPAQNGQWSQTAATWG